MTHSEKQRKIDTVVEKFYKAFDNRAGNVPSLIEMVELFCERSVVTQHREGICEFYTPSEFARPRVDLLNSGSLVDFHEWEESAITDIVGCIATRTSRYAKSGVLDGLDYSGNGTKVYQFVMLNQEWRIVALSWADDVRFPDEVYAFDIEDR